MIRRRTLLLQQLRGVVVSWNSAKCSGLLLDQSQATHQFVYKEEEECFVKLGLSCTFRSHQRSDGSNEASHVVFDTSTDEEQRRGRLPLDPQWTLVLTDDTSHFTSSVGPHPRYDTRFLVSSSDLDSSTSTADGWNAGGGSFGINHPITIAQRFVEGYSALLDVDADPELEKLKFSPGGNT